MVKIWTVWLCAAEERGSRFYYLRYETLAVVYIHEHFDRETPILLHLLQLLLTSCAFHGCWVDGGITTNSKVSGCRMASCSSKIQSPIS